MKRRVLVIGAGNFLGIKLIRALAASDWASPVPFQGPGAISAGHLDGIDAVFNGTMESHRAIVHAAQSLHQALRSTASVRVVHLSSMTVYGSYSGTAAESTPLRADLGAYGAAQVAAEALAARCERSVILRPGCEYGPGCPQWSERIARLLRSHRLGDLGANGDGACNLVYADDLVAAIAASLRMPGLEGARFNVAMDSPPTWNEYFSLFARALAAVPVSRIGGRRLKIESRLLAPPLKILELLGRRVPGLSRALPPPITPSLLNLCRQDITLDSRRAAQALGLAWTPLAAGLRQAAAGLRSRSESPA